ncbi:hypothetical protein HYH02_010437 [Chlamydomonas schloesseri]|uniref:NADPH:adrenodoxin oxidoreductase, mitochondrial n=1 Tax=Chlamydomonas schloesseri TaxID=2026947 RepID=A0A835T9Z9_9CHLO|nr:hypothetical protein HYH02_010437 [Chlamydomonas schloesseri]|eukprot:KAG2439802.1 hypothetical protein HYH02_010437 [Chlamydomonas schloesseri]
MLLFAGRQPSARLLAAVGGVSWQNFAVVARSLSNAASGAAAEDSDKLHVCVVGSGPAGFYTVDRLLKKYGGKVHVSILDRLPTPFGLVRSGVAPDHQDTKNVINQFGALAGDPRVSFFGNVHVGRDVALEELRRLHHAVVLAYGAESDRKLGVPGEEGPGVLSAREFVWWYNGHPDARHLPIDLSKVHSVAICGIGNVALDCARALLAPPARYQPTDMAAHALAELGGGGGGGGGAGRSGVRQVHLVARRGPVQAACTPKELKELLTECGVAARTSAPDQLEVSAADAAEMKATRLKRRVHELVSKAVADGAKEAAGGGAKELFFDFYRNPVEVLRDGASGAVTGLKVERTVVQAGGGGGGAPVAVGSGQFEVIPCQLVLKSIGYKGLPMEGVAFDGRRGVIPNVAGRVLKAAPDAKAAASSSSSPPPAAAPAAAAAAVDSGMYVVGWLKRGPTGIIGTNLVDAEETAGALMADAPALLAAGAAAGAGAGAPQGLAGLSGLIKQRRLRAVEWGAWRALDAAEVDAGKAEGRVREKVTEVADMLRIAGV